MPRSASAGWPARYPVAQPPNAPLVVALAALGGSHVVDGTAKDWAQAAGYVALGVWAYEEAAHGVNLFRRGLGVAGLAFVVAAVANGLGAGA